VVDQNGTTMIKRTVGLDAFGDPTHSDCVNRSLLGWITA
jgi:hypothetical protein